MAAAIVLVSASCGGSHGQSSGAQSDEKTESAVARESVADVQLWSNGIPVVVDFSAEWCPPCRKLKPIFTQLKEEYAGKVDFVTVNVDSMPQLSEEYKISSIPALVYLDADGKELFRSVGFRSAEEIKGDINKIFNVD